MGDAVIQVFIGDRFKPESHIESDEVRLRRELYRLAWLIIVDKGHCFFHQPEAQPLPPECVINNYPRDFGRIR